MLEHLTLRNGQQAGCYFILNWEHSPRVQYNAIFTKNILTTPLTIRIFFCPQSEILQIDNCRTGIFISAELTIFWFLPGCSLYVVNSTGQMEKVCKVTLTLAINP